MSTKTITLRISDTFKKKAEEAVTEKYGMSLTTYLNSVLYKLIEEGNNSKS